MINVIYAVAVLGALGLVFGIILAFAAKVFAVETDERREAILEALPGVNCGGCGYAGCGAYATAILGSGAPCNVCIPGGYDVSYQISAIMGVEHEKTERCSALIACAGTNGLMRKKLHYVGIDDCLAASRVFGGDSACPYGCLGLGSCVKACLFGAISVKDGVASVNRELCTGCMACVASCPKGIIEKAAFDAEVIIPCASLDAGVKVRAYCDVGCIACGICVKACAADAIHIVSGRAVIDYEKCVSCGECAEKCPRGTIVVLAPCGAGR